MFKAPSGPVATIQQALSYGLRDIPLAEPREDMASRMASALRAIAAQMRAADSKHQQTEIDQPVASRAQRH